MKERLQYFLTQEKLSPAKLADILGIQRSGLSHILSGRNKPGYDFILKLLDNFEELNAEWLITGKGDPYKSNLTMSNSVNNGIEDAKTGFQSTLFNENKEIEPKRSSPKPPEISINDNTLPTIGKKKILTKVLFVYSDGTFEEYNKGKELG
jgi:transcriptional regulator with XRE-family HTH domain